MTDPVQLLIDAGAIPGTPFGPQSRYNGVGLGVLQRPGEPRQVYVLRRFIPSPTGRTSIAHHVVSANERPDLLAARFLGDPLLYWLIADMNAVVDPHDLTDVLGRRVAIPQAPGF